MCVSTRAYESAFQLERVNFCHGKARCNQTLKSVSYTHLDVYKRQTID